MCWYIKVPAECFLHTIQKQSHVLHTLYWFCWQLWTSYWQAGVVSFLILGLLGFSLPSLMGSLWWFTDPISLQTVNMLLFCLYNNNSPSYPLCIWCCTDQFSACQRSCCESRTVSACLTGCCLKTWWGEVKRCLTREQQAWQVPGKRCDLHQVWQSSEDGWSQAYKRFKQCS